MREAAVRPGHATRARRIAVFVPTLGGGGAERAMLNLSGGLAVRGHDVRLVLRRAEGPYLKLVPPDVTVVDLAARRLLSAAPALRRWMAAERPDVLLSTMAYTNAMAVLVTRAMRGRPVVVLNEQVNLTRWINGAEGSARDRLMPLMLRATYGSADAVTAASDGVARDVEQLAGMARGRVEVIANPVVTPDIASRAAEPVDEPWLAPGAPPVILAIGRLTPQKDFPTLLRAFALLRDRPTTRLLILGEGPDRAALEARARELGVADRVRMPGFVDNPFAYLARARLFVLSSEYEGFGNVVAEALAVGTPVVSTDCESGPAEILENGRHGRLVRVGDAGGMAAAIRCVLDEPARREALAARAAAFSPGAIAAEYETLFERLIAARRA